MDQKIKDTNNRIDKEVHALCVLVCVWSLGIFMCMCCLFCRWRT